MNIQLIIILIIEGCVIVFGNTSIKIGLVTHDDALSVSARDYFQSSVQLHQGNLTLDILPLHLDKSGNYSNWYTDTNQLISGNLTAVIGDYDSDLESMVAGQLPYLITDPQFYDIVHMNRRFSSVSRQIRRHIGHDVISFMPVLAAMLDPVKRFAFKRIERDRGRRNETVVITENSDDYEVFTGNQLHHQASAMTIPFVIPKHASWSETRTLLARVREVGSPVIFLHSQDVSYIQKIFETARSLDMMTFLYDWILTYADMDGLETLLGASLLGNCSSVLGFQLVNRQIFTDRGLPLPPTEGALNHALLLDSLDIVVRSSLNSSNVDDFSTNLWQYLRSFPPDYVGAVGEYGSVIPVTGTEGTSQSSVNRVMIRPAVTVEWKEFRSCFYSHLHTSEFRLQVGLELDRKKDEIMVLPPHVPLNHTDTLHMPLFNQMPVKVALALAPPFVFEDTGPDGEKKYSGLMIDYLNLYAEAMNFTFVYEFVDGDVGSFTGNSWTGCMRHLVDEEVSLAVGGISVTSERSQYVDFTETTFPGMLSTLMKRPEITSNAWQFMYPFSSVMWVSIILVSLVISGVLVIMDKVDYLDDNFTTRDSFYYVAAILLSGSADTNPQSSPSRILIACFMFFSIVVFQSYVANMAAFLTTRDDFEDIPQNMHDLISQNNMELAALGEAKEIIKYAKKEPLLGLHNKLLGEHLSYKNHEEAIEGVLNGSFGEQALILVSSTTQYYASQHCDVMYLHHSSDPILYSLALPKGSQIKRVFDTVITNVRELGKDLQITERWYREEEESGCEHLGAEAYSANLETKSLSFIEMVGVFIVIIIGVGVATLVGVLGEILRRLQERNQRNSEP